MAQERTEFPLETLPTLLLLLASGTQDTFCCCTQQHGFFPSFPWSSLLVCLQSATTIFACMSLLRYPAVNFFFTASKTKFCDVPPKFLLIVIFGDSLYFLNLKYYSIRITFVICNILTVSGNTFFSWYFVCSFLPLSISKSCR